MAYISLESATPRGGRVVKVSVPTPMCGRSQHLFAHWVGVWVKSPSLSYAQVSTCLCSIARLIAAKSACGCEVATLIAICWNLLCLDRFRGAVTRLPKTANE